MCKTISKAVVSCPVPVWLQAVRGHVIPGHQDTISLILLSLGSSVLILGWNMSLTWKFPTLLYSQASDNMTRIFPCYFHVLCNYCTSLHIQFYCNKMATICRKFRMTTDWSSGKACQIFSWCMTKKSSHSMNTMYLRSDKRGTTVLSTTNCIIWASACH